MNEIDRLYSGTLRALIVRPDGEISSEFDVSDCAVLPGSFNPLHEGHRKLAAAASEAANRRVIFEISIENVDKPDLPREQLLRRLSQFKDYADVAVTRAPLFSDKASLLSGAWFILGYDTAVRLLDDRYYSEASAETELGCLKELGVKFLIAGRVGESGEFHGMGQLDIPDSIRKMFISIPENKFRVDISSTELRETPSR